MLRDTVSKMDLLVFGGTVLIVRHRYFFPEVVHMRQFRATARLDMILRTHTHPRH